ncbi:MAG TPA: hypothetical protein VF196_03325 [Casimicrobiaceae bacterium]
MSALTAALDAVRTDEATLIAALRALAERHRVDHDVFHMAHTLERLHRTNLERLPGDPPEPDAPPPAGSLLADLRELHLLYTRASIDWVILGQGAQAVRDRELLDAVTAGHAQTLRALKWTVTRIKAAAPQALTS